MQPSLAAGSGLALDRKVVGTSHRKLSQMLWELCDCTRRWNTDGRNHPWCGNIHRMRLESCGEFTHSNGTSGFPEGTTLAGQWTLHSTWRRWMGQTTKARIHFSWNWDHFWPNNLWTKILKMSALSFCSPCLAFFLMILLQVLTLLQNCIFRPRNPSLIFCFP